MSAYDGLISTGNVDLRPEYIAEIFSAAEQESAVLRLGRRLRNMTTREAKLKVSTALPEVYFVGEKGKTQTVPADAMKKVTKSEWEDVSMYAGELAAIVVVPNTVYNDADFDIFAELKAQLPTAIAAKIDSAVFYGTHAVDVPDDWSDGILTSMPAENSVTLASLGDIYDDILGDNGVFSQVEQDGYDVTGIVGAVSMKGKLRGLRALDGSGNPTGAPIFNPSIQNPVDYTLDGVPMIFPKNGGFDASQALMIAGDWDKLVYSIRQDVAFDVFTTGVVTDASYNITHNLMQEDLTALRVTFRMAWALPEPAEWVTASGVGYPFGALVP